MDWSAAIQEVIDAHADTKTIRDRLQQWVEGTGSYVVSGQVSFPWSDGTTVAIDTIPTIIAKANGSVTKTAYENLTKGDLVKLFNDNGTYKAKKLKASAIYDSAFTGVETEAIYYSSTYDRILVVYEGAGNTVKAMIGAINSSTGAITFGGEIAIAAAGTAVSEVKIVGIDGSHFVISWIDNKDIILQGGVFASTIALTLGVALDTGLTNVQHYNIAGDSIDTLNLVMITDDGAANHKLESKLYTYTALDSSIAFVAGSNKTMYTTGGYGTQLVIAEAYAVGYNVTDDLFHCLYCYTDATDNRLMHVSVNATDGTLSTPQDEIYKAAVANGLWHPRGVFYDVGNSQLVVSLPAFNVTNLTGSVYLLRLTVIAGTAVPLYLTFMHNYEPTAFGTLFRPSRLIPLYDSTSNTLYNLYNRAYTAGAYVIEYALEPGNDYVKKYTEYNATKYSYEGFARTADGLVFGAYTSAKAYFYALSERDSFFGIVNANVLAGASATLIVTGGIYVTIGLTPGMKYYMTEASALSTSKNEYPVGSAISATELKLF